MYILDLTNKVAVVTGGAKGIGRAIVEALVDCGAKVVVADINYDFAVELSREIGEENTMPVKANVIIKKDVEIMIKNTINRFGKLDILVNNAGISTMDYAINIKEKDWDRVMNINAKGTFLCSQVAAKAMVQKKIKGKIINIASQAGKNGYRCMANYCASKHAVIGFTKAIALELAKDNINVNAVCPGIIETDMKQKERLLGGELRKMTAQDIENEDNSQVPLGRTGQPQDVANLVTFLASSYSDYMTGQAINITGGMTMH